MLTSNAKRGYVCRDWGYVRRGPVPHGIDPQSPEWPKHCGRAMTLMGHRQAQAAALLSPAERLKWLALGAHIQRGKGRRKWRAILSERHLKDAYPLP